MESESAWQLHQCGACAALSLKWKDRIVMIAIDTLHNRKAMGGHNYYVILPIVRRICFLWLRSLYKLTSLSNFDDSSESCLKIFPGSNTRGPSFYEMKLTSGVVTVMNTEAGEIQWWKTWVVLTTFVRF